MLSRQMGRGPGALTLAQGPHPYLAGVGRVGKTTVCPLVVRGLRALQAGGSDGQEADTSRQCSVLHKKVYLAQSANIGQLSIALSPYPSLSPSASQASPGPDLIGRCIALTCFTQQA